MYVLCLCYNRRFTRERNLTCCDTRPLLPLVCPFIIYYYVESCLFRVYQRLHVRTERGPFCVGRVALCLPCCEGGTCFVTLAWRGTCAQPMIFYGHNFVSLFVVLFCLRYEGHPFDAPWSKLAAQNLKPQECVYSKGWLYDDVISLRCTVLCLPLARKLYFTDAWGADGVNGAPLGWNCIIYFTGKLITLMWRIFFCSCCVSLFRFRKEVAATCTCLKGRVDGVKKRAGG